MFHRFCSARLLGFFPFDKLRVRMSDTPSLFIPKMTDQEYKKRNIYRILRWAAGIFLAVLLIAAIGIWNEVYPFRRYLPAYAIAERKEGETRIHFLDVGQGDCAIVEFADGSALVVDTGDGAWEHSDHILRYLKNLHISALFLAITHADSDHCGGGAALLEDFRAENVFLPVLPASMGVYEELVSRAEVQGAEICTLARYDVLARADAYCVCISPYSVDENDRNDSSAVLFFSYAGVNVLFGGDISAEREARLLREQKLSEELGEHIFDSGDFAVRLAETDILKVSHHGSGGSSSEEWLQLLRPKTAVVSCGRGNPYGHPADGALTRLADVGADIYRIDELGDVMVTISKNGTYTTEYRYY